jgi:hypothetical protein
VSPAAPLFGGRTAYRLVSEAWDSPGDGIEAQRVTYLVDTRTYLPLEVRARIEYLRYEPLPVTDENRALLDMGDRPGARRMRG